MGESNIDVLTANRMYKSRIFAMLFSDRNELLKLYNAINGTSYDDPDLLQQNRHGEGLCDIVVNVQPESPELLLLPIQGGEHQDRHLGLPPDELTDPEAVNLGQHQVQQHQVEGTGLEQL